MREIQVQKLTKDNFGKYGEFLDLLDESELKKKSIFQEGFFADVVALEFLCAMLKNKATILFLFSKHINMHVKDFFH